jgi:hypothetical protein
MNDTLFRYDIPLRPAFSASLSADFHGATISLILASDTAAIILILPLFSPQLFAIIALRVSR